MLDLTRLPDAALAPLARVVDVVLEADTGLSPDRLMVVGAYCRDLLHRALGLRFALTATHDLDLALALRSWEAYRVLAVTFRPAGTTGIRFRIAELAVDLVPFGQIEAPPGTVSPPTRGEPMSVWAFQEIHAKALPLGLPGGRTIRIPSVAGYAAAKLAAWLDRSAWGETGTLPILRWHCTGMPSLRTCSAACTTLRRATTSLSQRPPTCRSRRHICWASTSPNWSDQSAWASNSAAGRERSRYWRAVCTCPSRRSGRPIRRGASS